MIAAIIATPVLTMAVPAYRGCGHSYVRRVAPDLPYQPPPTPTAAAPAERAEPREEDEYW